MVFQVLPCTYGFVLRLPALIAYIGSFSLLVYLTLNKKTAKII